MNWKTLLLVIILFLGALVAGRFLSGPPGEQEYENLAPLWCEPELGPCIYPIENTGEVRFSLSPKEKIRPMEPLRASVVFSNTEGTASTVTLTGLNMDMGHNRFRFQSVENRHETEVILPICTLLKMEWQAVVKVETGGNRFAIPFNFIVERK